MIQVQDYNEEEEEGEVSRAPSSSKEGDPAKIEAAVEENNGQPLLSARESNGIGGGSAATTSKKPSFKNSVFERLTATRNKVYIEPKGGNPPTLYCTTLLCAALHCTALHCTALHYTTLHCTALHCTSPTAGKDLVV
jgi:hypothetical protein